MRDASGRARRGVRSPRFWRSLAGEHCASRPVADVPRSLARLSATCSAARLPTPAKVRPSAHSPFRRATALGRERDVDAAAKNATIAALRASRPSFSVSVTFFPFPPLSQGDVDERRRVSSRRKRPSSRCFRWRTRRSRRRPRWRSSARRRRRRWRRGIRRLEEARERIDDLEGKLRDATRSGDAPRPRRPPPRPPPSPARSRADAVVELQKKLQVAAAMVKTRASEKAPEERLAAAEKKIERRMRRRPHRRTPPRDAHSRRRSRARTPRSNPARAREKEDASRVAELERRAEEVSATPRRRRASRQTPRWSRRRRRQRLKRRPTRSGDGGGMRASRRRR